MQAKNGTRRLLLRAQGKCSFLNNVPQSSLAHKPSRRRRSNWAATKTALGNPNRFSTFIKVISSLAAESTEAVILNDFWCVFTHLNET